MLKISVQLQEIIQNNQWINFGLSNNILNLSQLARFIKPQLEIRLKKTVTESSILMSLSRIAHSYKSKNQHIPKFKIENLSLNSDLNIKTYKKTPKTHKLIHQILKSNTDFITLSEGLTEINLIYSHKLEELVSQTISTEPIFQKNNLTALIIKFNSEYTQTPGFVFFILQQMYLQNINIVEITSTNTELILYIDKKEAKLAFDTLYQFLGR